MNSQSRFGGLRNHEIDACAFCNRSGPLHVQVGFSLLSVVQDSRCRTIVYYVQSRATRLSVGRQTEKIAEIGDILRIDIGLTDNSYRLPGAVDGWVRVPSRCDVVNRRKVVRSHPEAIV